MITAEQVNFVQIINYCKIRNFQFWPLFALKSKFLKLLSENKCPLTQKNKSILETFIPTCN